MIYYELRESDFFFFSSGLYIRKSIFWNSFPIIINLSREEEEARRLFWIQNPLIIHFIIIIYRW